MKKKILTSLVTIILIVTIVLSIKPEYRWLLLNGNNAKGYAINLLAGNKPKTPDWAIDLVVIKENGMVIFNEHKSEKMYAFSPDKIPNKKGLTWSHIGGSWYVGKI